MDKNEVIKILLNEQTCVKTADTCDRDCAKCSLVMDSEKIIEAYNLAIKLLSEQQWIPCSERLPEYWKRVLVCFKAGRKCPHDQIQVGYFGTHEVEDEWFEKIGNVTVLYTDKYYYPLDNVTAWMPLPEPWEGEQP